MREPATTDTGGAAGAGPGLRLWGATGLGLVALAVSLAVWDSSAHPGPTLCLFKRLTGVACPACGLTRAASLFAHGRIAEGFALHPAVPLLALETAVIWLAWGARLLTGRPRWVRWALPVVAATGIALVALWVVRLASGRLPP